MKLRNLADTMQLVNDGARWVAVAAGEVVTVSVETALKLLLQPRAWTHVDALA